MKKKLKNFFKLFLPKELNLFNNKKERTTKYKKEDFDINIEKGLYLGAGVKLTADKDAFLEVEPIFLDWGDINGHFSVYGTTRVGKTRLMVSLIRQCILRGMNILVVEPKGSIGQETIAWILQFLEEAGRLRDFVYISPMFKELSQPFNPLWGLSNDEIASLVSTLIPADDKFYKDIGYMITFAILIGLEFLEKVEGPEYINQLITEEYKRVYSGNSNIIDRLNNISDPDLATRVIIPNNNTRLEDIDPPFRSLITFADIATYSTQEGLQAIYSHIEKVTEEQFYTNEPGEVARLKLLKSEAMRIVREQAEKDSAYFSKVSSSFNIIIQQLSTGDLGEILCSTKINPIMDGYKNKYDGQVAVIQPFPLKYKKASDAFVQVFFAMFTAAYGNIGASGRAFPRDIALFIDEGGSVLYNGIDALFNKAGGLGLRIFMFTQSFADLEASIGPEETKIVNDNINTKCFMKMNDKNSRVEIAEAFGVEMGASSNYMGSKLDMRVSTSAEAKELLTPAHIAKLQRQMFLLQKKEGFYLVLAPFQPDPPFDVVMPTTEAEILYQEFGENFLEKVRTLKTEEVRNFNQNLKDLEENLTTGEKK